MVHTSALDEGEGRAIVVSLSDSAEQSPTAERQDGIGLLLKQVHTPESQLALRFVQMTVHDMHGHITVQHSAEAGTTTTLMFTVSRTVIGA